MTFKPVNPAQTSARDRIRFLIGDVNEHELEHRRLEDETIEAALKRETSEVAAALACCRELKAKLAREGDTGTKSAGLEASRRFERLKDVEATLVRQLGTLASPSLLSLSKSWLDTNKNDTDRPTPPFEVGMFDNL